MSAVTLKPGILVALRSRVSGGVTYDRVELESKADEDGRAVARWETTKVTQDQEEEERARQARAKAANAIRKWCIPTSFGLICPVEREAELDAAITAARAISTEHNAGARYTHIAVFALKGHIASTDEEATRAIVDEVRGLVDSMNAGITALDVEAIRSAANKARALSEMLGDAERETLTEAVKAARTAARTIAKRVTEDGEAATIVLADIKRGALEKARFAFLDLDAPEVVAPEVAAAPSGTVARIAGLDIFEPKAESESEVA